MTVFMYLDKTTDNVLSDDVPIFRENNQNILTRINAGTFNVNFTVTLVIQPHCNSQICFTLYLFGTEN